MLAAEGHRRNGARLDFCELLGCLQLELEPDDGFIADDPGVANFA